jgi:hypothetical protein
VFVHRNLITGRTLVQPTVQWWSSSWQRRYGAELEQHCDLVAATHSSAILVPSKRKIAIASQVTILPTAGTTPTRVGSSPVYSATSVTGKTTLSPAPKASWMVVSKRATAVTAATKARTAAIPFRSISGLCMTTSDENNSLQQAGIRVRFERLLQVPADHGNVQTDAIGCIRSSFTHDHLPFAAFDPETDWITLCAGESLSRDGSADPASS